MTTLTTLSGCDVDLSDDHILLNHVILPWEFNPHNVRLWIVSNEYGALGAVWANNEQDALDELVNNDLGNGLLIDEADADDETCRLGNAGEPACLDYCRLEVVRLDEAKDCRLLCRISEGRGVAGDTLAF